MKMKLGVSGRRRQLAYLGRIVASKIPRKRRATIKPAKFLAAAVQIVVMLHAAKLNTTHHFTGKTMSA